MAINTSNLSFNTSENAVKRIQERAAIRAAREASVICDTPYAGVEDHANAGSMNAPLVGGFESRAATKVKVVRERDRDVIRTERAMTELKKPASGKNARKAGDRIESAPTHAGGVPVIGYTTEAGGQTTMNMAAPSRDVVKVVESVHQKEIINFRSALIVQKMGVVTNTAFKIGALKKMVRMVEIDGLSPSKLANAHDYKLPHYKESWEKIAMQVTAYYRKYTTKV